MSFNSSMSLLNALDQSFVPETNDDATRAVGHEAPDIRQRLKKRTAPKGVNNSDRLRETQKMDLSMCQFLVPRS